MSGQPMGSVGQIMPVQANLRVRSRWLTAVQGANLVVNCVERSDQHRQAELQQPARCRRPRGCQSGARGRRQAARPHLGHWRGQGFVRPLRPFEGGRRAGRARGIPGCRRPASLDRVRAGGRILRSLCRARSHIAIAALDRRRQESASPCSVAMWLRPSLRDRREGQAGRGLRTRRPRRHDLP